MEGVAFSLRHNLEVAEAAGAKAEDLRAMGGLQTLCFGHRSRLM